MKRTALKTQLVASLLTLAFAGNFTISTAQAASDTLLKPETRPA